MAALPDGGAGLLVLMAEFKHKVKPLPIKGSDSPSVVLAQALEEAQSGRIKSVVIGAVDQDGNTTAWWSEGELAYMLYALESAKIIVHDQMREPDDEVPQTPPGDVS